MAMGIPMAHVEQQVLNAHETIKGNNFYQICIKKVIKGIAQNGLVWLTKSEDGRRNLGFDPDFDPMTLKEILEEHEWRQIWGPLTRQTGGGVKAWISETYYRILTLAAASLPAISLIPAIREISDKGQNFDDWSGKGLIEELARHQNPGFQERLLFEKFEAINEFLCAVTENDSASIEIPHDREHVLVHMDNKVLPLSSLGTGIHEVVMLAAFCTLMAEQIVCIEEPEIHLHPLLQRRLIQYLEEKTSNQYFIATHSATLIDAIPASIFHVSNSGSQTEIQAAITPTNRFDICSDLGYKASDILQSNAIIWIEGPSDRIYIRHWLHEMAPDLIENIDFSFMFYGGRLLSHLDAADISLTEDIDALIAVRWLNRNLAVVIDSDRASADALINSTKRRIERELNEDGGISWVTAGREIENYVDKDTMTQALSSVYQNFAKRIKTGQYDHVLPFKNKGVSEILCAGPRHKVNE